MPEPAPGEIEWPANPALDEVREWIRRSAPGRMLAGAPVVYRCAPWGLTARFAASGNAIFFKATADYFAAEIPATRLMNRHFPSASPRLIATREEPGRRWMLMEDYQGRLLSEAKTPEPYLAAVRTLAQVHAYFASALDEVPPTIPRLPATQVPGLLDELIPYVERWYASEWRASERLRHDLLDLVKANAHRLPAWAREVSALPNSLDHGDLHSGNVAVRRDGSVVLFDWSDVTVGCPFFSMDFLLSSITQTLGAMEGARLSAEYLDALAGWADRDELDRLYMLALCLGPVRSAYTYKIIEEGSDCRGRFHATVGWWLQRAVTRWGQLG